MRTVFIVVLVMCFKDAGIPAKEYWSFSSKLVTLIKIWASWVHVILFHMMTHDRHDYTTEESI